MGETLTSPIPILDKILGTTNSNGIDLQHPITVCGNLNLAIIPLSSLSCIHQSTIMANCRSVWSTGIPSQRPRDVGAPLKSHSHIQSMRERDRERERIVLCGHVHMHMAHQDDTTRGHPGTSLCATCVWSIFWHVWAL